MRTFIKELAGQMKSCDLPSSRDTATPRDSQGGHQPSFFSQLFRELTASLGMHPYLPGASVSSAHLNQAG